MTCPIRRVIPAIVAQAAATAAAMMPGRFFLGRRRRGAPERAHPRRSDGRRPAERLEMLEEAIDGHARALEGRGDDASRASTSASTTRACTRSPTSRRRSCVAAAGRGCGGARRAGRRRAGVDGCGGGDRRRLRDAGGDGPRYGKVTVCWAESESEARGTAHEWWPNAALAGAARAGAAAAGALRAGRGDGHRRGRGRGGRLAAPIPSAISPGSASSSTPGSTTSTSTRSGPDQEGFCEFYEREILPGVRGPGVASRCGSAAACRTRRRGYQRVSPYLLYEDAARVVEYLEETFGFEVRMSQIGGAGRMHTELLLGEDRLVMVGTAEDD